MRATKTNGNCWSASNAVQPDGSLWSPDTTEPVSLSKTWRVTSDVGGGNKPSSKTFTPSELSYLGARLDAIEAQPRACKLSIWLRPCDTMGTSRGQPLPAIRDLLLHGFVAAGSTSPKRLAFTELGRDALRIHLATGPLSLRRLYPRLRRRLGVPLDTSSAPPAWLASVDAEPVMDFLRRLMAVGRAPPCVVPRRDLLRLLWLANLADTHLFKVIADSGSDSLATDAKGLLETVKQARRNAPPKRKQTGGLREPHWRDDEPRDTPPGIRTTMAKATSNKAASSPAGKPGAKAAPQAAVRAAPGKTAPVKAEPVKDVSAKPPASAKAASSTAAAPSMPVRPALVTLKHISAGLGYQHGLAPKEAHGMVTAVFETIIGHLKTGARVRVDGFGVIEVKDRAARSGRNPATGEAIQIAASRKLVFRPAKELKAAV